MKPAIVDKTLPDRPPAFDEKPKRVVRLRTWIVGSIVSAFVGNTIYLQFQLGIVSVPGLVIPLIAIVTTWVGLLRRDWLDSHRPEPFKGNHGRILFVLEGDRLVLSRGWFLGRRVAPNRKEAAAIQKVVVRSFVAIAFVPLFGVFFGHSFSRIHFLILVPAVLALTAYVHWKSRDWERARRAPASPP